MIDSTISRDQYSLFENGVHATANDTDIPRFSQKEIDYRNSITSHVWNLRKTNLVCSRSPTITDILQKSTM